MRVRVKLIANYMKLLPPGTQGNTIEWEIHSGATIGDLLGPMGVPLDDSTVLLLNGRQAEADALLSEGDMVTAFSAIAGGATDSWTQNALLQAPGCVPVMRPKRPPKQLP